MRNVAKPTGRDWSANAVRKGSAGLTAAVDQINQQLRAGLHNSSAVGDPSWERSS